MDAPELMSATTIKLFTYSSGICIEMFFATKYEHAMADPASRVADRSLTLPFLKCAALTAKLVITVAKSAVPQVLCTSISVAAVKYDVTSTPPPTPMVPCNTPTATPSAKISRSADNAASHPPCLSCLSKN